MAPHLPPSFRCGDCRANPPSFTVLRSQYLYQHPLDEVVRGLKFGGLQYLGGQAARLMAARNRSVLQHAQVVVPVPLHWTRKLARGYNQASEIARPLARALALPYRQSLRRVRATPRQTRLSLERRRINLQAAFAVSRQSDIWGRHVLLVDDVATTGATANAAAQALLQGSARSVTVVVLGRTPPPGENIQKTWQDS